MVKNDIWGQDSKFKITVCGLGGGGGGGGGQATLGVVPRPITRGPVTREGGASIHGIVVIADIVHLIPVDIVRLVHDIVRLIHCFRVRAVVCCWHS